MDFIELTADEAARLLAEMEACRDAYGLNKIRVSVEGDRVKFKVNEQSWSPPMGFKGEPY